LNKNTRNRLNSVKRRINSVRTASHPLN
jgi:hypothetical protein